VCIVAVGTIEHRSLTLPIDDSFAVGPEIPVLVAIPVTAAANQVRCIKVHGLTQQGYEGIPVLQVMAGHAPNAPAPVIELDTVRRAEFAYLATRLKKSVTLGAGIEEQIVLARHDGYLRRAVVTLEKQ
jgi:hypothetical protein